MRRRTIRFAELLALIDRLHDEGLSEDEARRLQELVEQDPEALRAYVDYVDLQAGLSWESSTLRASRESGVVPEKRRSPILGFLGNATHEFGTFFMDPHRFGGILVVAVAMFTLGIWVASPGLSSSQGRSVVATTGEGGPSSVDSFDSAHPPIVVARLVRDSDAVWDGASPGLSVGAPLEVDRVVNLRKGTAEIAFDSGARVLLKGPARFALSSPMAGRLHYGSLVTDVPKEARGFVVETPRASIVDYGTSFSLNVDPKDQIEEAFVHQGEIRVGIGDKNDDGEQPAKKLFKGQGVRINADASGNAVMQQIARVSRSFPRLKLGAFQPRLPSEIGDLRLWLRADAGTYQDLGGETPAAAGDRVAQWIDQSGNGLNPRQQVASHRPQLVDAGGGRLALRFDSTRRQRLEEPCQTGPLSQVLDASDRGHPQFTICVVFSTVVTQTALPQTLFSQFPRSGAQTSRYFGIREDRLFYSEYPPTGIALLSAKETVVPNETYVAVLTRDGDMESIHINGQLLVANDYAERYAGVTPCRWWIGGRHRNSFGTSQEFFCGDLFELIMFSRAIPEKTRENLEMYLKNKYLSDR